MEFKPLAALSLWAVLCLQQGSRDTEHWKVKHCLHTPQFLITIDGRIKPAILRLMRHCHGYFFWLKSW